MDDLVVNVADLLRRPGSRRRERLSGRVDGLQVVGTSLDEGTEAELDVLLESVPEGLVATGTVEARWQAECRRCLRPVSGSTRAEFRELFERHPQEGETYPLRHEAADFAPLAREALVLELPLAPLCAEDCRGICPSCGADLNQGECDCRPTGGDPRWAALDQLRGDSD